MIRPWRIAQLFASRNLQSRPFSNTTCSRFENLPKSNSPIVSKLDFFNSVTGNGSQIPTYRVIDGSGKLLEGAELPEVPVVFFRVEYSSYLVLVDGRGLCEAFIREHDASSNSGQCLVQCSEARQDIVLRTSRLHPSLYLTDVFIDDSCKSLSSTFLRSLLK